MLRRAWRAAHADGQRRPIDRWALREEVSNGNGVDVECAGDRRRDGAVEEILRMPVSGPVVVRCFDCRAAGCGGCEVSVVMVCRVMVIVIVMMCLDAVLMMIITVCVDVQVIAAGVVVEVERGAWRRDRRHEDSEGQRGPLSQSCAFRLIAAALYHKPRVVIDCLRHAS